MLVRFPSLAHHLMSLSPFLWHNLTMLSSVIAGFFTGGALAVRGGVKAARNSAIMCAVFLAVIEGVGIGFQRMMADNTKLEVCLTRRIGINRSLGKGLFTNWSSNLASSPSSV